MVSNHDHPKPASSDDATPDASSNDAQPMLGDFSNQAQAYAHARPSYPPRLIQQLMRIAHIRPGHHVADLGAGTGIFTQQLLAQGLRVHAIEPNIAMRSQAVPLPGISWHEGTFEKIPLPDASVQWATAAQAFHWANPQTALPEIARILKPQGRITALWNRRLNDQNPVTQWTINAIHRHVPGFEDLYHQTVWTKPLLSTGHFRDVVYLQEAHFIPMSAQRYLQLWRSHNHLAVSAGPQKLSALLEELAAYLTREQIDTIDVPYSCQSWTATKTT